MSIATMMHIIYAIIGLCYQMTSIYFFCYDYNYVYEYIIDTTNNITLKQRAYIMTTKSSLFLTCMGIYFNYLFMLSNWNVIEYINSLDYMSKYIANMGVYSFTAYLIMDCYIGTQDYPKYMYTLSGYTHHIVYIFINGLVLYKDIAPLYMLYMVSEIPTFLLALGSYNNGYRSDDLFGLTFLMTRIWYHMFLTYVLISFDNILILGIPVLSLHIYWFKNWLKKYT